MGVLGFLSFGRDNQQEAKVSADRKHLIVGGSSYRMAPANGSFDASDDPSINDSKGPLGLIKRYSISRVKAPEKCQSPETKFWNPLFRPLYHFRDWLCGPDRTDTFSLKFLRWVPHNALVITMFLFMNWFLVAMYHGCKAGNCDQDKVLKRLFIWSAKETLMSVPALIIISNWYIVQFILAALPIGRVFRFQNRETDQIMCVRQNGPLALTLSLVLVYWALDRKWALLWMKEHYLQMLGSSLLLSCIISVAIQLHTSWVDARKWSVYGHRLCFMWNFFVGKALHPLARGVDVKRFFSLRPGLIGLVMLDAGLVAYQLRHTPSSLNLDSILIGLMHFVYVLTALTLEIQFLSSFRYTQEGFGYMHAWYSLVFVPFAWGWHSCLVFDRPADVQPLGPLCSGVSFAVFLLGVLILTVTSKQKQLFSRMRSHPKVRHLSYMKGTDQHKAFIASGPWGCLRHPNLVGEMLATLGPSLVVSTHTPIALTPWVLHTVYLVVRAGLKEAVYAAEYGDSWAKYAGRVKRWMVL